CVLAGLFLGLAGLVDFLVDCSLMTGSADCLDAALWGASGLELFCVPVESGGVGYVGETMEHLSSDYGTGGAGVLCALARLSKAVKGEEAGGFEFVLDELLPRKLVDMPELNRRMSAEIAEMRHLWPAWEACFASGWRKSRC